MTKKIAFVFPGQGSQNIGMLSTLAASYPIVGQTFAQASEALGYDLWQLTQEGPEEKLNQTIHTQPALLAASVAIWRIWQSQDGTMPTIMAGHSLGEYSALVCSEVLDFSNAIKLVALRGQYMQEAVPAGRGAMAAIVGLEEAKVQEICELAAHGKILSPANYNSIGQIVIAGDSEAVDRAVTLAEQAEARLAKRIPVSVPSHCALMKPAAEQLALRFKEVVFNKPKIDVINNANVTIEHDATKIMDALIKQLYSPVRWVETIQLMEKSGIETIVECGSGKVLAGLNKRIAKIPTISINDSTSLKQALETI